MIIVNIWPEHDGLYGHASLQVGPIATSYQYVSWWPRNGGVLAPFGSGAIPMMSFKADVFGEGAFPRHSIQLNGGAEARMLSWYHGVLRARITSWNAVFNCASVVAMCLYRAFILEGPGTVHERQALYARHQHLIWYPADAAQFAWAIQRFHRMLNSGTQTQPTMMNPITRPPLVDPRLEN